MPKPDYPVRTFRTRSEWAAWLRKHHATAPGIWLRMARSGAALRTVGRADALDVALCYGWIDGQAKSLDDETWLQKYTPRGPRSIWSKRNREHVARLTAAGLMQPAGLAAVAAAQADGRWDRAYDSPATARVPDDFRQALAAEPTALATFEALTSSRRYPFLHRIQTAVKPETRARRIRQFVAMLARGETF